MKLHVVNSMEWNMKFLQGCIVGCMWVLMAISESDVHGVGGNIGKRQDQLTTPTYSARNDNQ